MKGYVLPLRLFGWRPMPKRRPIYITATDTGVGKTVTTAALGLLLKEQGVLTAAFKPVQCAGEDAIFLKKMLGMPEELSLINPVFAREPLSPHLALRREGRRFDLSLVKEVFQELQDRYDQVLIEGAGGLMVPLSESYYNADLIREFRAEVVVVARLGLGTINHTLLTLQELKRRKIPVKGIVFSRSKGGALSLPERTNPQEIERLSKTRVLGSIPYIKPLTAANILKQCRHQLHDV